MDYKKYIPKDSRDNDSVYNSICFNLTNTCNTQCKYCFQEAQREKTKFLDKDKVIEILDYFSEKSSKGKKYIQYTGGEPFLHPQIFEIFDYTIKRGWSIRLQTNAMLIPNIDENKFKIFQNTDASTRVSLDGWNTETHEYLRAKGSFKKALEGLEILKKYFKYVVTKIVIHSKNFKELEKYFEFCDKLDIFGVSTNVLRYEGYAKKLINKKDIIPKESLYKELVRIFNKPKYSYLIGGNDLAIYYLKNDYKLAKRVYYIDYTGKVYPDQSCRECDLIGDIYKEPIEKVFNQENLKVTIREELSNKLYNYIQNNLRKEVFQRWKYKAMQEETNPSE